MFLDQDPCGQAVDRIVGSTGTAACSTIGPPSSSAVTRCTVAPLTARRARAPALRVEARERGRSDGWMFRMRLRKRLEQRPAHQPHEAGQAHQVDIARLELAHDRAHRTRRGCRSFWTQADGLDARLARASSPAASGRLEITTAIAASSRRDAIASMIDWRFDAAAGDQDAEPPIHAVYRTSPWPATTRPIVTTPCSPPCLSRWTTLSQASGVAQRRSARCPC